MKRKAVVSFITTAILAFLSMSLVVFGQEARSAEADSPELTLQENNTAYLNSYWFSGVEPMTNEQMKGRVLELSQYRIKYQLADIGILVSSGNKQNGSLPKEGYAELGRWMKLSRETDPNQRIMVMVNDGSRYVWKNGKRVGNPNFGNAVYNANLRAVADLFVNQGVSYEGKLYKADGIQLDIEGFLPDDPKLLETARYVKGVLGDGAIFSIAAPADPAVWSDAYLREMAGVFNMLNPMMYDQMGWESKIVSSESYQDFWKTTIVRYAHAIASSGHPETKLNPTMPAYERKITEDGIVYHDPEIENVKNSALGLEAARQQLALDRIATPQLNPNGVHGAGLFWWSAFIRPGVDPRTGYDGSQDRYNWMELWVHP
ncbi:glycoside hydrolase family 18 protein [Paenibacillus ginsengarvi]|uniref:Glycoside hydrolase family 18 protein n=1 Tax=Paenibacillus ginsengarvi TaxID=400777 RepID=A0A3B0CM01_9BACL|nr:glycoside hydrolase family 18 protein [Paenibacillus ginsengarvi]RKN86192.1 glycoside hydrolase family 18 protein [Paenibacillus ginsengarvi]